MRKAWSGSNDFTISGVAKLLKDNKEGSQERCRGEWYIHTWRAKKPTPVAVKEDKEALVVEVGRWKVGILRGGLAQFLKVYSPFSEVFSSLATRMA